MIPVEAIQRVMEQLGQRMDIANELMKAPFATTKMEGYGRKTELRSAIVLLEEVIAQYAPDHTGNGSEREPHVREPGDAVQG